MHTFFLEPDAVHICQAIVKIQVKTVLGFLLVLLFCLKQGLN